MNDESRLSPSAKLVLALVVLAVGVAQGFGRFTYPIVLPAIERDLLHSYSLAGWFGTANLAAYLVGVLGVSLAAARFEPVPLILLGLVLSTAGLAAMAVATTPSVLLCGMIATGIAGGFIWIPAPGLAGSLVPEHRRGFAIGFMASGIGVALLFASGLTQVVQSRLGENAWRPVWIVEGALTVIVTVLAFLWLREPHAERDAAPAATLGEILAFTSLRAVPGWIAITLAYAAYGLCYSIYSTFVVAALQSDAGFTAQHASLDFGIVGIAITGGGVLLGRLSDRTGRRPALVWGFVAMGACPLLVLLGVEPWVAVSAAAFGTTMSGLGSVVAAYVRDHTTEEAFAPAFGAITLFFGVAQLVGPELGGFLAEHSQSFRSSFLISAAAGFGGALASAALPRRRGS